MECWSIGVVESGLKAIPPDSNAPTLHYSNTPPTPLRCPDFSSAVPFGNKTEWWSDGVMETRNAPAPSENGTTADDTDDTDNSDNAREELSEED